MKKKLLFLVADLSNNCLGRAWILADMAAKDYDVEIAGMAMRPNIWKPLRDNKTHTMTIIKTHRFQWQSFFSIARALKNSNADIIYICKPKPPTLLGALLTCKRSRLIIDIDDWESAMLLSLLSSEGRKIQGLAHFMYIRIAEWMSYLIPLRSVSNRFLQKRYKGEIIPHVRNPDAFPVLSASETIDTRSSFGIPTHKKLVLFLGTPHWHKGVMELIDAVAQARKKHPELHFVIAGLYQGHRHYNDYLQAANDKLGKHFTALSYVSWEKHGELLSCVDIVVVPQKQSKFTAGGQTPSKIFDAMAAGRPLVVSDIADTKEIVEDTAWLVAPDSAEAIASALVDICENPAQAADRATRAKERFLAHYSYEAVGPKFLQLLAKVKS